MYISEERFARMLEELFDADGACYDEMNAIIRDCAGGYIYSQAAAYSWFSRTDVDEILNETLDTVRLKVFHSFLFVDGPDTINNDVAGFVGWVKRIARNHLSNFVRREERHHRHRVPNSDEVFTVTPSSREEDIRKHSEEVQALVAAVLDKKHQLHITFAWLLQMIYMLDQNLDHKDVVSDVLDMHGQSTFTQIYEFVLCASDRLYCLRISAEQDERIQQQLMTKDESGRRLGDQRLEEFFVRDDGKPNGKLSLSKWWSKIKGELNEEFDEPSIDKPSEEEEQKGTKRDETSDNE